MKDAPGAGGIAERLRSLSASGVADARGGDGILPPALSRRCGQGTVAGPVVTARCERRTAAAMLRALALTGKGDVLVVQGEEDWAVFGELTGAEAVRRGLAAVVVDGAIRDLDGLRALGVTVFARTTSPAGGGKQGGGEVQGILRIAGVDVAPGDWAVGDSDGVAIVPAGELETVVEVAEAQAKAEAELMQGILAGTSFLELLSRRA